MKYELNVGDYVETTDGVIGYIYRITDSEFYFRDNKFDCSFGFKFNNKEEYKYFNRIGKYDFTKLQKIEKLKYAHIDKKYGTKVEVKIDGETLTSEGMQDIYVKTTNVEIIDKINEIIDRLNGIEGK